ncbi:hypothetical protein ONZ43_g4831 [Nemania bipapillata]|uniref:Uncharacterized protein n=1 Tax=Nemania bipapillata TaxID=110536 RepID=A0ACC2IHV5_9PEZI|nr:hypothetical protein ONZ43_g4831 [Nemania bipapillata]
MGLSATLIEAPDRVANFTIPQDHLDICEVQGIPTEGNAAGNELWYDTEGFVTINPTTYIGAMYIDDDDSSVPASTSSLDLSETSTFAPKVTALSRRLRKKKAIGNWLE